MNLLNLEQRDQQPDLSIKDKIANELAECREERLFNQGQYQKENIGVWVDYGGVKTCFSPLRFV